MPPRDRRHRVGGMPAAFSGSTKPSVSSANKARARCSRDYPSGRAALSAPRYSRRSRRCDTAVRASVHVGDPEWFANQALAAGVILGGFVATGGLDELKGGDERDFGEEPGEPCSMCDGTGRTECMCTRWSDDGEGCSSCGYTGVNVCRRAEAADAVSYAGDPVETRRSLCRVSEETALTSSSTPFQTILPRSRSLHLPPPRTRSSADRSRACSMRRRVAQTASMWKKAEPRSEPGGPDGEGGGDPSSSKDDDFYAQSGEAIRTLRDDYPSLLNKSMQWGIYREDIGLVDEAVVERRLGHVVWRRYQESTNGATNGFAPPPPSFSVRQR